MAGKGGFECRLAGQTEVAAALRLVLGDGGLDATDLRVADFLSYAVRRKIDLSKLAVTCLPGDRRLIWAVLPLVGEDRMLLLLTPSRVPVDAELAAATLTEWVVNQPSTATLAQALVDPADERAGLPLREAGFETLATLYYLQRKLPPGPQPVCSAPDTEALPPGCRLVSYSSGTHDLFRRALAASYESSLDCPAINGLRDLDDILSGHRGAGAAAGNTATGTGASGSANSANATLWTVVAHGDEPAAILLMGPPDGGGDGTMELVYLGVSPGFRGKGLGRWCVREALRLAELSGQENLTLAVDAANRPALKLYYGFGLKRVHERLALLKRLRPGAETIYIAHDATLDREGTRHASRESRTASSPATTSDNSAVHTSAAR